MSLTVYCDSANWYDLSDRKVSADKFESAVIDHRIVPVLSFIHLLEFAKRSQPYRTEVSTFIDRLIRLGEVRWIKSLPGVADAEVRNAFLRGLGINTSPINAFAKSFIDTQEGSMPWGYKESARLLSVEECVNLLADPEKFKKYRAFIEAQPTSDIARLRQLKRDNPGAPLVKYFPLFLGDMLGKQLETPKGILIKLTSEQINQFSEQLDLNQTPAFSLLLAFFEGWSLTSGGEDVSNFEDLFHLVALAYCDVTFADKRTCDALSKVKACKIPSLNSSFESWVDGLSPSS
jgi:hypothetical protein